jgi:hypothetical protein
MFNLPPIHFLALDDLFPFKSTFFGSFQQLQFLRVAHSKDLAKFFSLDSDLATKLPHLRCLMVQAYDSTTDKFSKDLAGFLLCSPNLEYFWFSSCDFRTDLSPIIECLKYLPKLKHLTLNGVANLPADAFLKFLPKSRLVSLVFDIFTHTQDLELNVFSALPSTLCSFTFKPSHSTFAANGVLRSLRSLTSLKSFQETPSSFDWTEESLRDSPLSRVVVNATIYPQWSTFLSKSSSFSLRSLSLTLDQDNSKLIDEVSQVLLLLENLQELHFIDHPLGLSSLANDYSPMFQALAKSSVTSLVLGSAVHSEDSVSSMIDYFSKFSKTSPCPLLAFQPGRHLGDAFIVALVPFLSSAACQITDLNLCASNFSEVGAFALATVLSTKPSIIRRLDFSGNRFGSIGGTALSGALKLGRHSLQHLNLNCCRIGDQAGALLVDALSSCHDLCCLFLKYNDLGTSTLASLRSFIQSLPKSSPLCLVNVESNLKVDDSLETALDSLIDHVMESRTMVFSYSYRP